MQDSSCFSTSQAITASTLSPEERNPPVTSQQKWTWPLLGLCVIVLGLFGPSVGYEFVHWDDPWYVTNNPLIHSWSLENLSGILTQTVTRNYAPVTIFSYLLDYTFWQEWAGGYHLTNLLWHVVNTCLVYILVRQITGNSRWGWLTALLFAVHPVQIESVVWISARKGLLSAAFILTSLCFWLKPERTSRDELWGTLFFLLALFSKAVAIIVPGIVFVYDWLVRRKTLAEAFSRQFVGGLIAIWFTLLTAGAQQSVGGGLRHHFALSKLEMLGVDAMLLWQYLQMLFLPGRQSILYDPPLTGISLMITLAVLSWCVIGFWLWRVRHKHPLLVFAAACSLAPLVPVLNLFPITTIINDRYLYLPCIPIFAIAVAGVDRGFSLLLSRLSQMETGTRRSLAARGTTALCGAFTLYCSLLTSWQLPVWQNDMTLWTNAIQVVPDLPIVQYQHALALWNNGQYQAAIEGIDQALQLPRLDDFDRQRFEDKRHEFIEHLQDRLTQQNGTASDRL